MAENVSLDMAKLVPTTFLAIDLPSITGAALAVVLDTYASIDDVWTELFKEAVIISPSTSSVEAACRDETSSMWAQDIDSGNIYIVGCTSRSTSPPSPIELLPPIDAEPGPYLMYTHDSSIALFKVYRLYRDALEAFVYGIIPSTSGWKAVDPKGIPVPSKLYSIRSKLPFAGKRFALKDIFDVEGLQTYAGSLAYGDVTPLASHTASSVQRLLDLGAVFVGKTKTSQFAHGANPWDFIDFSYPWNPRGDGFLTAASSSSGSACAIAGYEWLDFAVGSDTRGSVRKPAALVGVYGIRPSIGIMPLDGVLPLAAEMDTAGIFAREPQLFSELCRHWYCIFTARGVGRNKLENRYQGFDGEEKQLPKHVLYPVDHFPASNPLAQTLYDNFVDMLVKRLGFSKKSINLTSELLPTLPNRSFTELQLHSNVLAEYHSYTSMAYPLIERYRAKYGQRVYPTLDTIPTIIFDRAQDYTGEQYEASLKAKEEFSREISKRIIKPDSSSCSESILIYDIGFGGVPSYRFKEYNGMSGASHIFLNNPVELRRVSDGFNYISSTAGLPEVTIPLGEVPYLSHVTGEVKMLPVAVQVVAHRGCDTILLSLLDAMKGHLGGTTVHAGDSVGRG
ncbi:hypothetical protein ONZ45_g3383 [Pleurotus djamor]|nr:hypothetical protein ONZ45_g3383 [Pleurotus djamor]